MIYVKDNIQKYETVLNSKIVVKLYELQTVKNMPAYLKNLKLW